MFSQVLKTLLFMTDSPEDTRKIRRQVLADNRKFTVVWSSAELFYWIYCFVKSFFDEAFTRCRDA